MTLKLYWYPKCSTCRKAKKWLDDQQLTYTSIDIVQNPPSKQELHHYIRQSELPIKKFFNTNGKRYRELNVKEKWKEMTDEEKIDLLASDGMLIKRPIVTDDQHVSVGFREEVFQEMWQEDKLKY